MITEYKLLKKLERINIELLAAELIITTHSQKSVLLDYRKNVSEELLPQVECFKSHINICKQKLSEYVKYKSSFKLKVIVPENIIINCKLFSGSIQISGLYKRLVLKQKNGMIKLNAAYFETNEHSLVETNSGEINIENNNNSIRYKNSLTAELTCSNGGIVVFESDLLPIKML